MVSFRYDAPEYSSSEIVAALAAIAEKREIVQDSYSLGGEVEGFETDMARLLGKERAIFMPTGTLANHLAIRALASKGSRIIVQERSHICQDCGDSLSTLSGFQLIPLGHHRAGFTLEEAQEALADASQTRVRTGIGAISIECPVRRCHGEAFDFGEMARLTSWAKAQGIGTHLDGARIFIASTYTGIPVRRYAEFFDTVYVSLYKYFGTPSGALLAGPASIIEGMYHERRMFGGGLNQAWVFAALAREALSGFEDEFARAVTISEELIGLLAASGRFTVSRIPNGTNIFVLELGEAGGANAAGVGGAGSAEGAEGAADAGAGAAVGAEDAARFSKAMRARGILLPEAQEGRFYLKVNTSLLGRSARSLLEDFLGAVDAV